MLRPFQTRPCRHVFYGELLASTFEIIDVLFYEMAVYFGYKYAFRQVSDDDFNRALGKPI